MSYVSYFKYQDGVTDILQANGVTDAVFDEVADVLAHYLETQPEEDFHYGILGEDGALTPSELATQVRKRTEAGVSYVETFIAGVLSGKHLGLEESLEELRKAG